LKILHICSDFAKQSIYNQLVSNLDARGVEQLVYVPVRSAEEIDKYRNRDLIRTDYEYAHILRKSDRFLYHHKINKTTAHISKVFGSELPNITHAHFLFSDGGIALNLLKSYGIPYIVAVRNTDINIFFKYFIHLRKKGLEILQNAEKIIFLSEAYKQTLLQQYIPKKLLEVIDRKSMVVPNGVDPFWLSQEPQRKESEGLLRVLYVGDFTSNKNIPLSISAIEKLRNQGHEIEFDIVGGGGDDEENIIAASKKHAWIHLHPRTNSKEELRRLYERASVFAMPSRYETFGLVYIEAMSQGCPTLFTKGQGIDGYFEEGVIGYSVLPNDVNDLASKILLVAANFNSISKNCIKFAQNFSWETISEKYIEIYQMNYDRK
jgi:glycosyltransferase involved in cell wall biosynthesis